jgi:hypothetical protein
VTSLLEFWLESHAYRRFVARQINDYCCDAAISMILMIIILTLLLLR